MNIWLVKHGEPLPIDEGRPRLMRASALARRLAERGNKVTLWSSTIHHSSKTMRAHKSTKISVNENYSIWLLHGRHYGRNITFKRLFNHQEVAREFLRLAPKEEQPDVILACFPTIENAAAVVKYGKSNNIPTVIDIRDLWPDIFAEVFPKKMEWLANIALYPLFRMTENLLKNATAITAVSHAGLEWGLEHAGRTANPDLDKCFRLSYSKQELSDTNMLVAGRFWDEHSITGKKGGQFVACFFGILSERYEISTMIDAARILSDKGHQDIKFVICGNGEAEEFLKEKASGLKNVLLPGWMDRNRIRSLLDRSSAGILPYPSSRDYTKLCPNKIGEYLSAGLPILSSVQGEISDLLESRQCGITFPNFRPEVLASEILELSRNPEKSMLLQQGANKAFEEQFNAEKVYTMFCEYLEAMKLHTALKSS